MNAERQKIFNSYPTTSQQQFMHAAEHSDSISVLQLATETTETFE